ncbi:MAG TPA: hypothetical protein VMB66_08270 [Candidatus Acidoferrales bacterium]|jgi:protein-S-isoprenylcysteine O-methyltransferase Ste14|nr:hypothetical protein [Candidatus Acidoferrales bacterium]
MRVVRDIGWVACVVYATIPTFWFMIHPLAERWRARRRSPFRVLLPAWIGMWIVLGAVTVPWWRVRVYETEWMWIPAAALFAAGIFLYRNAGGHFSWSQLGGLPEVRANHRDDRLVTTGIRARVRHPVYLAHLCEMTAWSLGTGLVVCWALTAFAMATGAGMIWMEDAELEKRFGQTFVEYRERVPAVLPRLWDGR